MCEECQQVWIDLKPQLKKWFPDLRDDNNDAHAVLFAYTGYPSLDSPEQLREQLQYLADHGPTKTLEHIIEEMDAAMEELHEQDRKRDILFRKYYKDIQGNWRSTSIRYGGE